MLKKIKFILKIIEWFTFIVLLCLLFVVTSPKLPFKNIPKSFIIVSGSMEPAIKTGSVAFIKTINPKNLKPGDIIAFTSPSNSQDTIVHRIDSISSAYPLLFKTKGDNNQNLDAWDVQDVGVKGVYFFSIPYLGTFASGLKQPLGFILVIVIPALIFIISQILNIKKAISDEVDQKVLQRLDNEKETKNPTIFKSILFLLSFLSLTLSLKKISSAKALFSDTSVISGINITVADFGELPSLKSLSFSPLKTGFDNNTNSDNTIYNKTTPVNTITYPLNSSLENDQNPSTIWFWDGRLEGTVSDNSEIDHVEISIQRQTVNLYWNGHSWVDFENELIARIGVEGVTSWSYQINPFFIPLGKYKIISHAIDKAGNVINSAVIEFENTNVLISTNPQDDLEVNLSFDYLLNNMRLEIKNIKTSLDYEILYTGNEEEKGFFGKIATNDLVDSNYSKEFYLGVCSDDGVCIPEIIESGSLVKVSLFGTKTITKTFYY